MAYPIKLLEKDFTPVVFFFNPNIYPYSEYKRRCDELISYCEKQGYAYILSDYQPNGWYECVKGLENEPEKGRRCNKCFEYRLLETAKKAKEMNIEHFTTTLTVSPHKVSRNIFEAGKYAAAKFGCEFLEYDFKKQNGFLHTMKLAKENNFYRQQYCGCEYSL